jgi:hypothetical protein
MHEFGSASHSSALSAQQSPNCSHWSSQKQPPGACPPQLPSQESPPPPAPYRVLMPASSSASVVAGVLLHDDTVGNIVAPFTFVWPRPSA